MKYQKEFEEYIRKGLGHAVPFFILEVLTNGEYRNLYIRSRYDGFVAGIESGIQKKEPTLLELVHEWRNSDISDEELLNNICEEVGVKEKPNSIILDELFHSIENKDYVKHRLVDLKYINGAILQRRVTAFVNWGNRNILGWRPSATQD